MRSAYTGETIPLYGSGECVRDFIYIDDVARVVSALIGRPEVPRLINIGSAEGHSIQHLLEAIERVSGSSIRARHFPARRFDVRRNVLDCRLLNTLVEFERTPLYEGLTRTWKAATDALESEPPQQASRRAPNAR
jgi:UDP-glucose 4-epimerase